MSLGSKFLLPCIIFSSLFVAFDNGDYIILAQKKPKQQISKKVESASNPDMVKEEEIKAEVPETAQETAVEADQKKPSLEEDFNSILQRELETTPAQKAKPIQERPSWAWQFIKTLFVLSILILIFWGVWKIYFFKKNLPLRSSRVLNILYEYDLLSNKKLQILELGNRLLVLGLSDSGIQLITEISDKDSIEKIKLNCEKENSTEKPDFLLELTNVIKDKISGWVAPQKTVAHPQKVMTQISGFSKNQAEFRKGSQDMLKRIKENKSFFNDLENV